MFKTFTWDYWLLPYRTESKKNWNLIRVFEGIMLPKDKQHGWPDLRLFYTRTPIDLWTCTSRRWFSCKERESILPVPTLNAVKKDNEQGKIPWRESEGLGEVGEEWEWRTDLKYKTLKMLQNKKKKWVIKISNILMQMVWTIKISAKKSLMNKISKFLMTGSVNSAVGSNIGARGKRKIQ